MKISHVTADSLAAAPGIRHAFLSRDGGVSRGIYAGLNCGLGSDDDPGHIQENRARAAQTVGVETHHLRTLYQVHSANVIDADHSYADATPHADALVCTTPEIAIGVLAADCAPVLLADPQARVIGAAHAGWRGALNGVVSATIAAMLDRGAKTKQITAAVGPCIGPASYEVGPEFPAGFLKQNIANERFFVEKPNSDRLLFDLPAFVKFRLAESGIAGASITGQDTYTDESFFSYRRSCHREEPDYGRNLSVITLQANC